MGPEDAPGFLDSYLAGPSAEVPSFNRLVLEFQDVIARCGAAVAASLPDSGVELRLREPAGEAAAPVGGGEAQPRGHGRPRSGLLSLWNFNRSLLKD